MRHNIITDRVSIDEGNPTEASISTCEASVLPQTDTKGAEGMCVYFYFMTNYFMTLSLSEYVLNIV